MPMSHGPAFAALILACLAQPAAAACNVALQSINFGAVDVMRQTTTTGKVEVECDDAIAYEVAISTDGANGRREMAGPNGAELDYFLYSDAAYTQPWGETLGTGVSASNDGSKRDELVIYGVIPSQPSTPAGVYLDSLQVTLHF